MEFRISIETQIKWPHKCVWCLGIPTIEKMEASAGWNWWRWKGLKVEYPLCSKHYFWVRNRRITDIVLVLLVIGAWISWVWGLISLPIILVLVILKNKFNPVEIRESGDFYILKIRNKDYANEFRLLNNLMPEI